MKRKRHSVEQIAQSESGTAVTAIYRQRAVPEPAFRRGTEGKQCKLL